MRLPAAAMSLAVASAAVPGAASASSPDAWAEFEARVVQACRAASGLREPRASAIVGFDDRAGMVAVLVSDRGRGGAAPRLCLYDKRTRQAHVDEAPGWRAPPSPR
ncbi:hypothetical protein D3218_18085 [Aureimonas flava]|uniref:Uncharacterized protein n=1 Tax=Aureimonas flava TaxID=2320271 RepID=A0A3A1WFX9_9HYPH|nr:hypothetical protein [Aureimonas flava]RIX97992.1 hypothetical protein D3218_18085 [Aureimonas flava]